MKRYDVVRVTPFVPAPGSDISRSVGELFARNIFYRLKNDFGGLFKEVVYGNTYPSAAGDGGQSVTNELVISGTVLKYHPGSRLGRRWLGLPMFFSDFTAEVVLRDGTTGETLLSAPLGSFWAWAGLLGEVKGIEDHMEDCAASIANTVARLKGWKPK
ncbi:MAG: hypothetical protein ABSA97_12090 [Verrucomicrobiia bacterium]